MQIRQLRRTMKRVCSSRAIRIKRTGLKEKKKNINAISERSIAVESKVIEANGDDKQCKVSTVD
jgi:hypothetical protein